MSDKTTVCGAGCYKLALMHCNCFIGASRAGEDPPSVGDPMERSKVSMAHLAPSNPGVHEGMDNTTKRLEQEKPYRTHFLRI